MQEVLWKGLATGLLALVGALLLQYVWDVFKRCVRKDLPPGPYGLPLLGYLLSMPRDHHGVEALRKKYGNVFGLHLGSRYVVFLCNFNSVKEAFSQDALLNRPEEFPFKNELSYLIRELASCDGKPVLPTALLTPSMSNIISALVFGRRFEYDDPERIYLDHLIEIIPALAAQVTAINFFPWLRKLFAFFRVGPCERLRDALVRREDFSESKIHEHEETYKEGYIRDYIDGFLSEMKQQQNEYFTRNLLKGNVSNFFGAGSETVRSTMEWMLLMCTMKPELQRRIQAEIDAVLMGNQRSHVLWSDRNQMPYTQAFIWETMRYRPVVPLNIMRYADADVEVGGYVIPRGSIVIASIWSVFHDKCLWEDPEVFRPERFLVENETKPLKPEQFIPFSYGKRACPGEIIATMEVFLYFTTLLQHFTVEAPPDGPPLVFEEITGLSLRPKPQELVFRPRRLSS
ncbi:hypothetical protein HPB50_016856 [Hyalomma asiaticum]|uniref:Uncharacterized protein n=1 Tax=Hyalomma asiaticum TaxID=266040 RepID=A0ACB7S456_HYAAI|nr:hypothetical protein HPB50_016856 [Hyalomma asiaticum]